jgi:hypothetical protein
MLWLYDETEPYSMHPADVLTTLTAAAIASGVIDPPEPLPMPLPGEVVELAAIRALRRAG